MKRKTNLSSFVKTECANFVGGECVPPDKPCKILDGERCNYFEKAVLGPPSYKFQLAQYNYAILFRQYEKLTGKVTSLVQLRQCECGAPKLPGRTYCADCAKKKAKEGQRTAYRKRQKQKQIIEVV